MAQPSSISAETETLTQVFNFMETFRAFDSNNDGKITSEELRAIMTSLGYHQNLTDQDIRCIMLENDKDRDGLLSLEEFLEMNTKGMELPGGIGTLLNTAFDVLIDYEEGCEFVTGEDLFEVLQESGMIGVPLQACNEIVRSMDVDGDGAVSFEDFKVIMNALL